MYVRTYIRIQYVLVNIYICMYLCSCSSTYVHTYVGAAVLSEYTQLSFTNASRAPPLPQSVVDQRGGHTGCAVNKHSRLRFNIKVPSTMNAIGTNFPPRPAPIVIEKPPKSAQSSHLGHAGPIAGFSNQEDSFSSLESKLDLFLSDNMALASWLARRDLERNRELAFTQLQRNTQDCSEGDSQSNSDQSECDRDGRDDGSVDNVHRVPTHSAHHLQMDTPWAPKGTVEKTAKRLHQIPKSVHFQEKSRSSQPLFTARDPPRQNFTVGSRLSYKPPEQQVQSAKHTQQQEQDDYVKEKSELSKLCQQLTGQLTAIEGVLRRRREEGYVEAEEEEEDVRRKRLRGEEQVMRSNRLVYNLRQQVCVCVCMCVCVCVY